MFEHEKKETKAYFKRKDFNKIDSLLSSWYGTDRAANEMVPRLPKAVDISSVLDQIISGMVSPGQKKLMDVKSNWVLLVGDQISKIAHPVKIYEGVVYVEVVHNAWLRELNGITKKMIIKNINKYCGAGFCRDIRFTPAGRGK